MGKALSVLQRSVNRFNVENRAAKVLSKEKPTPAPKHESTIKEIEALKSVYPNFAEEQSRKDPALDDRLKKVFVQSQDPVAAEDSSTNPTRYLPQDRTQAEDFEFGFKEPKMIPQGRCSLKQALKFIVDHQTDPSVCSVAAIAKEYKIDQEKIEKILFHFRAFRVHIPNKSNIKVEEMKLAEDQLKLTEGPPGKIPHEQK